MSIEQLNKYYRLQGRCRAGGTDFTCVRNSEEGVRGTDWRDGFLARRRMERCQRQETALQPRSNPLVSLACSCLLCRWEIVPAFSAALVLSRSVVSDSLWTHRLWPARLLCPWDFPVKILEWVAISSSRDSSRPRDRTLISCISCIGRRLLYY